MSTPEERRRGRLEELVRDRDELTVKEMYELQNLMARWQRSRWNPEAPWPPSEKVAEAASGRAIRVRDDD